MVDFFLMIYLDRIFHIPKTVHRLLHSLYWSPSIIFILVVLFFSTFTLPFCCSNDGTEFAGSIYQKVNSKAETAVHLAWTAGSNNTLFSVGAKYQLDKNASLSVRNGPMSSLTIVGHTMMSRRVTSCLRTLKICRFLHTGQSQQLLPCWSRIHANPQARFVFLRWFSFSGTTVQTNQRTEKYLTAYGQIRQNWSRTVKVTWDNSPDSVGPL